MSSTTGEILTIGSAGIIASLITEVQLTEVKECVEIAVQGLIGVSVMVGIYKTVKNGKEMTGEDKSKLVYVIETVFKVFNFISKKRK